MARGIKRQLNKVLLKVSKEISGISSASYSPIGAALSSEGYSGGYRDAISDVILALNGQKPRRRGYWD